MKIKAFLLALNLGIGCSSPSEKEDHRKPQNTDLEKIKQQVLALQGTLAQLTAFTASDFTSCAASLPPFQTLMCKIAQTATAEQQALFVGQIQQVMKVLQTELYGVDCIDATSPGCPVSGSVTARVTANETIIATQGSNITSLQASVTSLSATIATLTARLNNFNGSGSSVETIVTGIQSDIATLDSRLNTIEQTVNDGDIYKTFLICNNVSPTIGPAFEPILITGDNKKAVAYIVSSTSNGMGQVAKAGVTGNYFATTAASTKTCNFKIYDRTTTIKLCWNNTNRSATSAQIDTACNSPTFASPTAACTCVN